MRVAIELYDAYVTGIAKVTFIEVIPLRIASFAGATIATALGKSNTLSTNIKMTRQTTSGVSLTHLPSSSS